MTDPRLIEAIHGEIDGVNTAEESRRLRQRLISDAPGRALLEQLRGLEQMLGSIEEVDPPPELRRAIRSGLASRRPPAPVISRRSPAPLLRYGSAVAAGLLLGLLVARLLPVIPPAPGEMAGSLTPTSARPVVATAELDADGLGASVRVTRQGDELSASVELEADRPLRLIVLHDDETRLSASIPRDGFVPTLQATPGRVSVGPARRHAYRLVFSARETATETLTFQLFDEDRRIDEKTLEIDGVKSEHSPTVPLE